MRLFQEMAYTGALYLVLGGVAQAEDPAAAAVLD